LLAGQFYCQLFLSLPNRFLTDSRLTKMSFMVLADQVEKEGKVLDINRKGSVCALVAAYGQLKVSYWSLLSFG
jgi:hypothetical protein